MIEQYCKKEADDDGLQKRFDEFSNQLDRRIRDLAERGPFSSIANKSEHHGSTGEVLYQKFVELLYDLDAMTIKYIAEDRSSTNKN